jgi:hypothetical protein
VSLFGPDRRVTVAEDWAWDVYARRVQLPAWRPAEMFDEPDPVGRYGTFLALLTAPLYLVTDVLAPLLRIVIGLPFALVRAIRPKVWKIEAVTFWPREERYVWTTTGPERARVLNEIADALEQRTFAQPRGAIFHGRKR